MAVYNTRIVDGVNLDVTPSANYKGPDHPVRLLVLISGQLVIGTVTGHDQAANAIAVTFPMEVFVDSCEHHDEEEMYEFVPYLRNLVDFDIQIPHPVIFNLGQCVNALVPSMHLVANYYKQLLYMKAVSNEELGHSKPETLH